MGRIKSTLTVVCAAMLLTATVAAAQGTLSDRKTIVTFSGPVSLPGTTLPAGTYVFRIADSPTNRNIVQVFDRDEAKLITTLLAIPAERAEAAGDPVVTFKETAADRPPAVRYWYYAGEKAGNELVYPKGQAMMIARASGESVSAIDTESNDIEVMKKGDVTKVTASTEPQSASTTSTTASSTTTMSTPTTTAPTTTPEPAPAPTTVQTAPVTAEPTTAPAPAPVTQEPTTAPAPAPAPMAAPSQPEQPVATSGRLPSTASELPAIGLLGLLSLAGAFAVRAARRSMA
ncbi:MAG: hypothetical protein QOI42_936 [Frankiaceae bacterium]|nr:hypothetical protein [Frankiaceae bacterium]